MLVNRAAADAASRDGTRRVWRRAAFGCLLAAAAAGPVAWTLAQRVPWALRTPLIEDRDYFLRHPVELSYDDYPGTTGLHEANIVITLRETAVLLRHDQVRFVVATFETSPTLVRAVLSVEGTDCVYTSVAGATYPNNGVVAFDRGARCSPLHGEPTGRLLLKVSFRGPGRLVLWTFRTPFEEYPQHMYVTDPTLLGVRAIVRGDLVDNGGLSTWRRIDLLAYVWELGHGTWWLWSALGASVILFAAAGVVLLRPSPGGRRQALGTFAAAWALAAAHALLAPPFHAPDETHHFASFANLVGKPALIADADAWRLRDHFTRIQFHPEERFGPQDVGTRSTENRAAIQQSPDRSVLFNGLLRTLRALTPRAGAPASLLLVRQVNALVFGIAAGLAVALLSATGAGSVANTVLVLLTVPALPFFAMHFSNYGPLASVYVVLASGLLAVIADAPLAHRAGPAIGLACGAAMLTSRSALPVAPAIACVLLGRAAATRYRFDPRHGDVVRLATFWSGVAAPVALAAFTLASLATSDTTGRGVVYSAALVLLACAAGVSAELRARRRRPAAVPDASDPGFECRGLPVLARGLAILLAAVIVGSLAGRYPHLANVPPTAPADPVVYLADVLRTMATAFRLRDSDLLLTTTFWGAFGWLETIPSRALVSILNASTGAALAFTFWRLARERACARLALAWSAIAGLLGSVVTATLGVSAIGADLHGRYLLAFYLVLILLAWSGPIAAAGRPSGVRPRRFDSPAIVVIVLGLAAGIHGYCLARIVARYF